MIGDDDRPRTVGAPLGYRDDAEAEVLAAIRAADDRRAGSPELEAAITGWASRYHLAAARGNLLRPFAIDPALRILEIGAGCGAITRALGETGARVVALEGNPERARAAAARCRDLAGVEVIAGALDAFEDDEGFDLAVVVGVLEYAGSKERGGGSGATAFLDRARRLLRPDGNLLLAIENQLGLRYLLGGAEDHLGQPWVGVSGYPGSGGVRTWTRRALAALLDAGGFVRQRWLFPFPDYKLPTVVLARAAYEQPDAVDFVDQLVGSPAPSDERGHVPATDERQAHRVFLEAGLGPDVANAFLVCASGHAGDPGRLLDEHDLAWHASDRRRPPWRRLKTVRLTAGGRQAVAAPLARAPGAATGEVPSVTWLRHERGGAQPYIAGRTLEQEILAACLVSDPEALRQVLVRWNAYLDAEQRPGPPAPDAVHPLLPADAAAILPGRFVDVDLANFVVDDGGALHYIDDEWRARGGVDAELTRLRALWHLAVDLVRWRSHHPWPGAKDARTLIVALGAAAGIEVDEAALERLRRAEAALLAAVSGRPRAELTARFDEVGVWQGPRSAIEIKHRSAAAYEEEIDRRGTEIAALHDANAALRGALEAANDERDAARARGEAERRELMAIHRSKTWRLWQLYLRLRRLLGLSRSAPAGDP